MNTKLTLDQPFVYQIRIAGHLREEWADWTDGLTVTVESGPDNVSVTTLTGTFDQAALLGLLRRLYYLGFPLISVNGVQQENEAKN